MTPAGLEPAIPGSVGRCLIHWATGPDRNYINMIYSTPLTQVSRLTLTTPPRARRPPARAITNTHRAHVSKCGCLPRAGLHRMHARTRRRTPCPDCPAVARGLRTQTWAYLCANAQPRMHICTRTLAARACADPHRHEDLCCTRKHVCILGVCACTNTDAQTSRLRACQPAS